MTARERILRAAAYAVHLAFDDGRKYASAREFWELEKNNCGDSVPIVDAILEELAKEDEDLEVSALALYASEPLKYRNQNHAMMDILLGKAKP